MDNGNQQRQWERAFNCPYTNFVQQHVSFGGLIAVSHY